MVIATGNSGGGVRGGQDSRIVVIPGSPQSRPRPPSPPSNLWRGIHFQMKCDFLKNSAFPGNSKGGGRGGQDSPIVLLAGSANFRRESPRPPQSLF